MTHGKFQTILGKSPPSQKMHLHSAVHCWFPSTLHVKSLDQMRKGTQTNGKGLVGSGPSFPQNYDAVTYAHTPIVNKLTPCHSRHKISRIFLRFSMEFHPMAFQR